MTRSRWTPLADAALGLEKACLALRDPDSAAAVETAKAAIDEAAAWSRRSSRPPPLHRSRRPPPRHRPEPALRSAERTTDTIALANRQVVIERPRPPSPRWAIECAFGAHLQPPAPMVRRCR
jgi:hypothetical protein